MDIETYALLKTKLESGEIDVGPSIEALTEWLEENITQETGYVIDNTLTVSGAASDAQATGKMVTVSDTNPNLTANKVWVKKTPTEIEIPTMEDLDDISDKFICQETDDGSYVLKCVVSGGTAQYNWVKEV